ncbi:MAG: hypothetical protein QM736_08925 [Vicinamibacterales bacterium]
MLPVTSFFFDAAGNVDVLLDDHECRLDSDGSRHGTGPFAKTVPSQFSAIGFHVSSGEDLAELATHVAERADTIDAAAGQYLQVGAAVG